MTEKGLVIGVDTAKGWLDVGELQTDEDYRVGNDPQGWTELISRLKGRKVKAIGVEPSGGYERGLVRALRKALTRPRS